MFGFPHFVLSTSGPDVFQVCPSLPPPPRLRSRPLDDMSLWTFLRRDLTCSGQIGLKWYWPKQVWTEQAWPDVVNCVSLSRYWPEQVAVVCLCGCIKVWVLVSTGPPLRQTTSAGPPKITRFLRGLRRMEGGDALLPFVSQFYGSPSTCGKTTEECP